MDECEGADRWFVAKGSGLDPGGSGLRAAARSVPSSQDLEARLRQLNIVFGSAAAKGHKEGSAPAVSHHAAFPAKLAGVWGAGPTAAVAQGGGHFRSLGIGNAEQIVSLVVAGRHVGHGTNDKHFRGPAYNVITFGVSHDSNPVYL